MKNGKIEVVEVMPQISPIRMLELVLEARQSLPAGRVVHAKFVSVYTEARQRALAACMRDFKPASPTSSIVVPIREIKHPKLIVCGFLCGDPACGRMIARDGSIWPSRDTGFRVNQLTGHNYGI